MNVYEEYLRELFGEEETLRDPVFCGKSVIAKIDDQIIVKIILSSVNKNNRTDAILCTVLNRYGVIDRQLYPFADMIMSTPTLRDTDGKEELASKFSPYDYERIREIVMGYIDKFYDKNHDSEGER